MQTKPILNVLLKSWSNVVLFRIYDQDADFTKWLGVERRFNNMDVRTVGIPDLCSDVIFLRGKDESKNDSEVALRRASPEEAQRYVKQAIEALRLCGEEYKKTLQPDPSKSERFEISF